MPTPFMEVDVCEIAEQMAELFGVDPNNTHNLHDSENYKNSH